ncbi:MAG: OmpA family protein [Armatimonadetes bacterium]|nr:OmpA family protein [Armatimonadota bacterium]
MAGRRKKRGHGGGGEHENAERWLLTYADMITLLVAFFIMLYAMSVMNQQKFQQLAISVRSGFGGSLTSGAPTIIQQGGGIEGTASIVSNSRQSQPSAGPQFPDPSRESALAADRRRLDRAFEIIQAFIKKNGLERQMQVSQDERGVIVTVLTDKMLFDAGQADLRPQELGPLAKVAQVVNTVPDNHVRIEGHTDDLPIRTARFPSNWELSVTRATTVLRFFAAHGVTPKRLEAAGYADQRPLVPNTSEQGRARNRRVEIVILRRT